MSDDLTAKRAIVLTGTSSGLGKALHDTLLTDAFADDRKIYVSRRQCPANPPHSVDYVQTDLQSDAIDAARINVPADTAQIVFISNAGVIDPIAHADEIESTDFRRSLNVNLHSPLAIAQHLSREARKHGVSLRIVNISSGAAMRPIAGWAAYCTGKAAIRMAFDALALENDHVEVRHFDPGVMDTSMQATIRASSLRAMSAAGDFQRMFEDGLLKSPADVAGEIVSVLQESWR
ncbi:MAG: SDR family NAD(P)-dependent oxidoreductase [Pseudomonadota bacterium]